MTTIPDDLRTLALPPGTEGWARSSSIYNHRLAHQRPAAILQASSVDDVVRFAAERELALGVRADGHGVDGRAMPDDALVLDLTAFKEIAVDHPMTRRVPRQLNKRKGSDL